MKRLAGVHKQDPDLQTEVPVSLFEQAVGIEHNLQLHLRMCVQNKQRDEPSRATDQNRSSLALFRKANQQISVDTFRQMLTSGGEDHSNLHHVKDGSTEVGDKLEELVFGGTASVSS